MPSRQYVATSWVTQSHDPQRPLRSHVVQRRDKAQNTLLKKHVHERQDLRTKGEMAEDLRRAVANTAGSGGR